MRDNMNTDKTKQAVTIAVILEKLNHMHLDSIKTAEVTEKRFDDAESHLVRIDNKIRIANHKTAKHSSWIENFESEEYKQSIKDNKSFTIKAFTIFSTLAFLCTSGGLFILKSVASDFVDTRIEYRTDKIVK